MMSNTNTAIILIFKDKSPGMFSARLENGELVCRSHSPFFDSARALLTRGYSPTTIVAMRHNGTKHDALRAMLSTAAALSAEHDGHPRFRRWRGWRGRSFRRRATPCGAHDDGPDR